MVMKEDDDYDDAYDDHGFDVQDDGALDMPKAAKPGMISAEGDDNGDAKELRRRAARRLRRLHGLDRQVPSIATVGDPEASPRRQRLFDAGERQPFLRDQQSILDAVRAQRGVRAASHRRRDEAEDGADHRESDQGLDQRESPAGATARDHAVNPLRGCGR